MADKTEKSNLYGYAIAYLIKQEKLTDYEFGRRSSLEKDYVSKLVNGKIKQPGKNKRIQIAEGFGITESELEKRINSYVESLKIKDKKIATVNYIEAVQIEKRLKLIFVGREKDISFLNSLVVSGHKLIQIWAPGGQGKTSIANNFLKQLNVELIEFPIAKDVNNVTSAEILLEEKLRELGGEPSSNFIISLERLKKILSNKKIGILIDSIETILDGQGRFIKPYRSYLELLRVLGNAKLNSITIITSREKINEPIDLYDYELPKLTQPDWDNFLNANNIVINSNKSYILKNIHYAFNGNALAMKVICGAILKYHSGDIEAYWKENKIEYGLETTTELAIENLINSQFERFEQVNRDTYILLCRLGCYRFHEVKTISNNELLVLLWDIPKTRQMKAIRTLKESSLIEYQNANYLLHPFICSQSLKRIEESGEWFDVNNKIADYYYSKVDDVYEQKNIKIAFEAFEHYYLIKDYNSCYKTLIVKILKAETVEQMRSSVTLWNHTTYLIEICEKILPHIELLQKVYILISVGICYSEIGGLTKALEISSKILKLLKNSKEVDEDITFAKFSAYSIACKSNRLLGKLNKSLVYGNKLAKIVKLSKNEKLLPLAFYEIGTTYIELEQPNLALTYYIKAALEALKTIMTYHAVNTNEFSNENENLLNLNINIESHVEKVLNAYNNFIGNQSYTNKIWCFRILYSIANSLNLMKYYKLAKKVIDKTLYFAEDNNSQSWINLILGNYFSNIGDYNQALHYYSQALSLSEKNQSIWVRVNVLHALAQCNCKNNNYSDALSTYKELENIINNTDYNNLKFMTYYSMTTIYSKLTKNQLAILYYNQTAEIVKEF